jgi:hypothetical protein
MSRSTKTSTRGSPLPDLESMGLSKKMRPLAALISEQTKLLQRSREVGYECQRLQEQIKQGESQYTKLWGRAMRSGEDAPDDEPIKQARVRLEEARKEHRAIKHAGDLSFAELQQSVAVNRDAWDALVQERGAKILSEAQQISEKLSRKLAETEGLCALHGFLQNGASSWTPPMPASVTIENIVHERRRNLGLLDGGAVVLR